MFLQIFEFSEECEENLLRLEAIIKLKSRKIKIKPAEFFSPWWQLSGYNTFSQYAFYLHNIIKFVKATWLIIRSIEAAVSAVET